MPILASDIKLVASQVMDDVDEGGGPPTPNVIPDGARNGLFKDISQADRAGGRFNMRKLFASVQTDDTDTLLGPWVIVSRGPADPRVSMALFSTGQVFDRRQDAQNRVESYLSIGPEIDGYLFGNHVAGQRSLQIFQRVGGVPPPIGRTLVLLTANPAAAQYVKVTDVKVELRTFTFSTGSGLVDYQAQIVTCDISDRLRSDFSGSPASRLFARDAARTAVYDTVVADAAQYYGIAKLVQEVAMGELVAHVDSITTQLAPSSQSEINLADTSAAGQTTALVASAPGTVSFTTPVPFSAGSSIALGNSLLPGTLSIAVAGGTLTDDAGRLMSGATVVGQADYARGLLVFASDSPTYSGSKTIAYRPAAAPLQLADSASIAVTQETRAFNYNLTIVPPPAPGTTRVAYMSGGSWYELRDNGAGLLRGTDSSYGVGTISYSSGTASVSLNVLPDPDSDVIFLWGAASSYADRSGATLAATLQIQLAQAGVSPGSLTLAWNDGTARTVTDNGRGELVGAVPGTFDYNASIATLRPAVLPSAVQAYTASFSFGAPSEANFANVPRNSAAKVDLFLGASDLRPGSVEITWPVAVQVPNDYFAAYGTVLPAVSTPLGASSKSVRDDGQGALKDASGTVFGAVNYGSGVATFNPDFTQAIPRPVTQPAPSGKDSNGRTIYTTAFLGFTPFVANSIMPVQNTVAVKYRTAGASMAGNDIPSASALTVDLTANYAERVVPGSVRFTLGGRTYFDRAGLLYCDLDIATGAATAAGRIDYTTGLATVTLWTAGASSVITLASLLTQVSGISGVDSVVFRTPVAPLRSGSLQIRATRLDGSVLNVTAASNGSIAATGVLGTVNYATGVVRLRFGAWVAAAGNELQPWYAAAAVREDGKIFKPMAVWPDTIKYNAVGYTSLSLDAALLGVDPVRLPQDGRVPIFRKGGFVVIGHTGTTLPATVGNGQTIDVGRVRLSRVRVIGADGLTIPGGYTQQLDAGTVTFTDVTGYKQPVRIEHRIEDLLRVGDVQINGQLGFLTRVTHTYPAGSWVSSALMMSDLRARVSATFDQMTWTGVWADNRQGADSPAAYDDVAFPIEVTNRGAVTERWLLQFTGPQTYNLIGEHLGQLITGQSINADCAPINPATGAPYMVIRAGGFHSGWAPGNALRINTVGPVFPFWVARTVQMGAETVVEDDWELLVGGGVNRP